jgi:hypothetical protein
MKVLFNNKAPEQSGAFAIIFRRYRYQSMRILNNRFAAYVEKFAQLPPVAQAKVYELIDDLRAGGVWMARFRRDIPSTSHQNIWKDKINPLSNFFQLPQEVCAAKIEELPISTRLNTVLIKAGCVTMADILAKTPWNFLMTPKMGKVLQEELLHLIQSFSPYN